MILFKNGICGIKDLGSFNGTLLNNQPIKEPRHLTDNDILRISSFIIRLQTPKTVRRGTTKRLPSQSGHDPADAPRQEPRTFPGTELRLPRAMENQADVDMMIGDILPNPNRENAYADNSTQIYTPGSDTNYFLRSEEGFSSTANTIMRVRDENLETIRENLPLAPESGPNDALSPFTQPSAATGLKSGETPRDVQAGRVVVPAPAMSDDEFSEQDIIEPEFAASPQSDRLLGGEEEPLVNPEVAEAIIPLNEPETTPQLILKDDTQNALEKLIEGHPKRDWFGQGGRQAGLAAAAGAPSDAPATDKPEALREQPGDEPGNEPGNEPGEVHRVAEREGDGPPLYVEIKNPLAAAAVNHEDRQDDGESAASFGDTAIYLKTAFSTDSFAKAASEADSANQRGGRTEIYSKSLGDTGNFVVPDKASGLSRGPRNDSTTAVRSKMPGKRKNEVLPGVQSVAVAPGLLAAIEKRLSLYIRLGDIEEERKLLRLGRDKLPPAVVTELERQTAEMDNIPVSDEIDRLMQQLRGRQEVMEGSVAAAKEKGLPLPEEYTPQLRRAEDLALAQWQLVRESNSRDLPNIFREAYAVSATEPLAVELTRAQINHGKLMGGAIYLLALETLFETIGEQRKDLSTRMRRLDSEGAADGIQDGFLAKLGGIGRIANKFRNRKNIKEEVDKLKETIMSQAARLDAIQRETVFMEKYLVREFKQVYANTALFFCREEAMPLAVRAFLRHGVIGFQPWWMNEEIRDFITRDCQDNVVSAFEWGGTYLNVIYADEYLTGVGRMECTPSPDESLVYMEKNSIEWKTERAYRRIINARSYNVLMEETLSNIEARMKNIEQQILDIEYAMTSLKNRPHSSKNSMFDLQTEHQAMTVRRDSLQRNYKRIEKEVVFSILESVEEAEGRFRKGELKMPAPDALIRRECRAFNDLSFTMRGSKERFLPMVIRENFLVSEDVVNERGVVRSGLVAIEELDPGVFLNTIIGAKKKENRVDLRLTPIVVIVPCLGNQCVCAMAREGMDGGHLLVPSLFLRPGSRQKLFTNLMADYRWETSREMAGRDSMKSNTLVGVFTKIRWEWRNFLKAKREKGLIYNDLSDLANWRRVYELYLSDATTGARQLFMRNRDLYENIIGKFVDLPAGVKILRQAQGPATADGGPEKEEREEEE